MEINLADLTGDLPEATLAFGPSRGKASKRLTVHPFMLDTGEVMTIFRVTCQDHTKVFPTLRAAVEAYNEL